jgi:hypothetical protein
MRFLRLCTSLWLKVSRHAGPHKRHMRGHTRATCGATREIHIGHTRDTCGATRELHAGPHATYAWDVCEIHAGLFIREVHAGLFIREVHAGLYTHTRVTRGMFARYMWVCTRGNGIYSGTHAATQKIYADTRGANHGIYVGTHTGHTRDICGSTREIHAKHVG